MKDNEITPYQYDTFSKAYSSGGEFQNIGRVKCFIADCRINCAIHCRECCYSFVYTPP